MFNLGLLECEVNNLRIKMKNNFVMLVEFYNKMNIDKLKDEVSPHIFFISFLVKNILFKINLEKSREKCDQFFDFFCKMLSLLSSEEIASLKHNPNAFFNIQELFQFTLNEFMKSLTYEKNQEEKDYLLQGYLQLFESLNELEPKFKEALAINSKFLNYLFHSGLFEMPTGSFFL